MSNKSSIHGLLLLDKPASMSSQKAVFKIKHAYQAEKAGHTGSLDPLATGMLPICLGEATKFADYLLASEKKYYVEAQLGIRTTTLDAEGEVCEEKPVTETMLSSLEDICKTFVGKITQIPPMYSALKYQGQPLYKLARLGQEITREAREVKIDEIKLCWKNQQKFALEVSCSKGTYIRTLIDDIGAALTCGAHVTALRRVQVGPFANEQMVSFNQIALSDNSELKKFLLPTTSLVNHLPQVIVTEIQGKRLQQGVPLQINGEPVERVQIINENKQFLGLGEVDTYGTLIPRRLMRSCTQES